MAIRLDGNSDWNFMSFPGQFRSWLARSVIATFGICSIIWAISSLPVYRAEAAFASSAQHILLGEKFNTEQLSRLRHQLDTTPASSLRSLALNNVAIIRLRLAENDLAAGNRQLAASDLEDLQTAMTAALAGSPTSSFLWLTAYWLQNLRPGSPNGGLNFLRMSYLSGPNEGWIAAKRNPLALSIFPSLPDEIAEQVLAEFIGLVRSGLYLDAASILAGSGGGVREKLLSRLVELQEADRRAFAKVLQAKNLDGVSVPGADERPSRRF